MINMSDRKQISCFKTIFESLKEKRWKNSDAYLSNYGLQILQGS